MTKAEKARLTGRVQAVVAGLKVENALCCQYLEKSAAAFSPTNFNCFREMLHGAWWLIALEASDDAKRLLDALCEVDDELYWMFEWLGATFATRAWLHSQLGELAESRAAAEQVLDWLGRDPNAKPLRASEYHKVRERYDIGYASVEKEASVKRSTSSLCSLIVLLVLHQQAALASAEPDSVQGYDTRIAAALGLLRQKIEG